MKDKIKKIIKFASKINNFVMKRREQPNNYFSYLKEVLHNRHAEYKEHISRNEYKFLKGDLKPIAFYLPQFHSFKENDKWWGKGFTEWTNVTKAQPQFEGHYQPHLAGELGYYNLLDEGVQESQVKLAKQYGIYGFCFYFYFFDNGKRLLEAPLDKFYNNKNLNFNYCICWANENWSRRWDGHDQDILIQQTYAENYEESLAEEIKKYLKDDRYIRIDGKPLVIIYRMDILPNLISFAGNFRSACRNNGIGEIYLASCLSFKIQDAIPFGFDGNIEFPPHQTYCYSIKNKLNLFNAQFKGEVFDYEKVVEHEINKKTQFPRFRCVFPSWDNEARKPGKGTVFYGSAPSLYAKWLYDASVDTINSRPESQRFLFVNAWNEWAEGAHLEPDRRYGHAYLETTYQVINSINKLPFKEMICVGHDAHFNGAQILLLNIIRELTLRFKYNIHLFLGGDGLLVEEYSKYANVYIKGRDNIQVLIHSLAKKGISKALCNSAASGEIIEILSIYNIEITTLIHELPWAIKNYNISAVAQAAAFYSHNLIFPAQIVKDRFLGVGYETNANTIILPQGLYNINHYENNLDEAYIALRNKLNIPTDKKIILGCGYGDYRKGIDLFCQVSELLSDDLNICFVWLGNISSDMKHLKEKYLKVYFMDVVLDQKVVSLFMAGCDIFFMSSREDPFPSVVLEALSVGRPVIAFRNCGGIVSLIEQGLGLLAEKDNLISVRECIDLILNNPSYYEEISLRAKHYIKENHIFKDYIYAILEIMNLDFKKVSVVVPNYNYDKYLKQRLDSVVNQNYPIYEVIVLDDNSSDNSISLIEDYIANDPLRNIKLFKNETNSGSVFKQWYKGISLSQGEYIWIAEADDFAKPELISALVEGIKLDKDIVLAYSQSYQMDENGKILADNYLDYTNDICADKWLHPYTNVGENEVVENLCIKNTIPNVSATLIRRDAVPDILTQLLEYKIAGDWWFYINLLNKGKIYYCPLSLNYHRRHSQSVTIKGYGLTITHEISTIHKKVGSLYKLSSKYRDKMSKYEEELKEQFNL